MTMFDLISKSLEKLPQVPSIASRLFCLIKVMHGFLLQLHVRRNTAALQNHVYICVVLVINKPVTIQAVNIDFFFKLLQVTLVSGVFCFQSPSTETQSDLQLVLLKVLKSDHFKDYYK